MYTFVLQPRLLYIWVDRVVYTATHHCWPPQRRLTVPSLLYGGNTLQPHLSVRVMPPQSWYLENITFQSILITFYVSFYIPLPIEHNSINHTRVRLLYYCQLLFFRTVQNVFYNGFPTYCCIQFLSALYLLTLSECISIYNPHCADRSRYPLGSHLYWPLQTLA